MKSTVLFIGIVSILTTSIAYGGNDKRSRNEFYVRGKTFAETMTATRRNLKAKANDILTAHRPKIIAGGWKTFGPVADSFEKDSLPSGNKVKWKRKQHAEGEYNSFGKAKGSYYLQRTLTADSDGQYLINLGGNNWMKVWINGSLLFTAKEGQVDLKQGAKIIPTAGKTKGRRTPEPSTYCLPLKKGMNEFVIKLYSESGECSFYYSDKTSPFAIPAKQLWLDFHRESDWFFQDNQVYSGFGKETGYNARGDYAAYFAPNRSTELEQKLINNVLKELKSEAFKKDLQKLIAAKATADDPRWLELYVIACKARRQIRLKPLTAKTDKVAYSVQQVMGGMYLGTSGAGPHYSHSQLRLIDLSPVKNGQPLGDTQLLDAKGGLVRDPELSFDASKMMFAWKKSLGHKKFGEFKIYEIDLATRELRQLTDETTWRGDFEPCYLPNGDIMFSSDRCVIDVTCGGGRVPNLYIMNKDGKYARRVGFDQTQTAFPHLLDDGRVVFTRRDYNDRGQSYGHALFVMNYDGTRQTEYYGNNSFFPTSIQHTRQIPGTMKTMGIAGGYHTSQGGKLVKIDPSKGTQNYDGLEFYLNFDAAKYDKYVRDGGKRENYIRVGAQASYPFPLDENCFLCSYNPLGGYLLKADGFGNKYPSKSELRYGVYFMDWKTGARELLASDPQYSCMSPTPIITRKVPQLRPTQVDYTKKTGICYVQNVYHGPSSKGIKPGTIKKLRISKILYKPTTIGGSVWKPSSSDVGPGKKYASYGFHSITPVGVATASFDAKQVIGEVDVHPDGSAMFEVPAREPIYIMMLNERGESVQTMRSWMTLMPNEKFSCVGCHEENNSSPIASGSLAIALKRPPQKLQKKKFFEGKPFSYHEFIQPIWDKHCISCHAPGKKAAKFDLTSTIVHDNPEWQDKTHTQRKFYQSYLTLLDVDKKAKWGGRIQIGPGKPNKWVNYFTRFATVELTPPYYAGSTKSGIMKLLREGHKNTKVSPEEYAAVAAWIDLNVPFIGEYDAMNLWSDASKKAYADAMENRRKMEAVEQKNIQAFIDAGQP